MKKMSKADAGRLGAMTLKANALQRRSLNIEAYLKDPIICKKSGCSHPISYDKRTTNLFCSRSCSASYNNSRHPKRVRTRDKKCVYCKSMTVNQKFCNRTCRQNHLYLIQIPQGLVRERSTLKKYLIHQNGHQCFFCKQSSWMKHPIPLEVDHIDGNAGNNLISNLRLLCPNCHALTPTAKGRNKGYGRKSRGLPLY